MGRAQHRAHFQAYIDEFCWRRNSYRYRPENLTTDVTVFDSFVVLLLHYSQIFPSMVIELLKLQTSIRVITYSKTMKNGFMITMVPRVRKDLTMRRIKKVMMSLVKDHRARRRHAHLLIKIEQCPQLPNIRRNHFRIWLKLNQMVNIQFFPENICILNILSWKINK